MEQASEYCVPRRLHKRRRHYASFKIGRRDTQNNDTQNNDT